MAIGEREAGKAASTSSIVFYHLKDILLWDKWDNLSKSGDFPSRDLVLKDLSDQENSPRCSWSKRKIKRTRSLGMM